MKPLMVLGVTGSIATVRAFDLCRELRRKGFEVKVVMSEAAEGIITKDAMEFASGKKVISRVSGKIEHVEFFGKKGKAKLLLIAPATANTISKIAMGIDDTPVTTFATVAIGSGKPVLLAPAMHKPMYEHPIVLENLKRLEKRGVKVIEPLESEGKAKLRSIETICLEVERALGKKKLGGKKVLIASGAFREEIDEVRVITNKSTGRLGAELARECFVQGAEVKLFGNGAGETTLAGIFFDEVHDANELEKKVLKELSKSYDYFFCPAALPDFVAKKAKGKISSAKKISLELLPKEKFIEKVAKKFPKLRVVAFKAEHGKAKTGLKKTAESFRKKSRYHAVVATDLKRNPFSSEKREMIYSSNKSKWINGTKKELARKIVELL